MWAILLVSVVGLAIIIERIIVIYNASKTKQDDVFHEVTNLLRAKKVEEAKDYALNLNSPLGYISHAAIEQLGQKDEEKVRQAITEVQLTEEPLISRRLGYLAVVANIATLLGLLGTIIGLIMAFYAVSNVPAAQRTAALAIGIQVAMATTAFGLIIAIPTLAVYGWLSALAERFLNDMDEISTRMSNYIAFINKGGSPA
jgi:biopolymer transport protein ExbB/TolQ